MIPLLLEELVNQVRLLQSLPPLQWRDGVVEGADLAKFEQEAAPHPTNKGAQVFDPLGLKSGVWAAYKAGTVRATVKECDMARVVALLPKGVSIPTADWGRIFQWLGPAPAGRWTVYWFGAATPRRFPGAGVELAAEHLNGGYTHICSTDGVVIYRLEEATRVLMHELLHAACLDEKDLSIPEREAHIETWAELFLIAHRSKGSASAAARLWRLQSQWVADTNARAAAEHGVKNSSDYGWRYLNGRAAVYQKLGCELPMPSRARPAQSRFTHPALD